MQKNSPDPFSLKFRVKFPTALAQTVKDAEVLKYEFAIHDASTPESPTWVEINVGTNAQVSPDGKELWCTLSNSELKTNVRPEEIPDAQQIEAFSYEFPTTGSFIDSDAFDAGVASDTVPGVNVRVSFPPTYFPGNWTATSKTAPEGTLAPWVSDWSKPFFIGGGANYLQVKVSGATDRCTVRNQADWLYYSGHGHSEDGRIDIDSGDSVIAADVEWFDDLDIAIIAGCAVLDINDLNGNYDDDNADGDNNPATGQEVGPASKLFPGEEWANTGPSYLLGYNWDAPKDGSQNSQGIISTWTTNRATAGVIEAWRIANDNFNGHNACAIDAGVAYYYFERTTVGIPPLSFNVYDWKSLPVASW